jgi:hypothetical protein
MSNKVQKTLLLGADIERTTDGTQGSILQSGTDQFPCPTWATQAGRCGFIRRPQENLLARGIIILLKLRKILRSA